MSATRICKVCGKEYEYCRTNRVAGIFRWQDVSCCPEHGSIYFARVLEARGETPTNNSATENDATATVVDVAPSDNDEEGDDFFGEDSEDLDDEDDEDDTE